VFEIGHRLDLVVDIAVDPLHLLVRSFRELNVDGLRCLARAFLRMVLTKLNPSDWRARIFPDRYIRHALASVRELRNESARRRRDTGGNGHPRALLELALAKHDCPQVFLGGNVARRL